MVACLSLLILFFFALGRGGQSFDPARKASTMHTDGVAEDDPEVDGAEGVEQHSKVSDEVDMIDGLTGWY